VAGFLASGPAPTSRARRRMLSTFKIGSRCGDALKRNYAEKRPINRSRLLIHFYGPTYCRGCTSLPRTKWSRNVPPIDQLESGKPERFLLSSQQTPVRLEVSIGHDFAIQGANVGNLRQCNRKPVLRATGDVSFWRALRSGKSNLHLRLVHGSLSISSHPKWRDGAITSLHT
jgi:hypothetical protein